MCKIVEFLPPQRTTSLTDGWGASRLVFSMLGPRSKISLRPVTALDEDLILLWANTPEVRVNSFSPERISHIDHTHWFQRGLKDVDRLMFIAITDYGLPIGQIRFDRQSKRIDDLVNRSW